MQESSLLEIRNLGVPCAGRFDFACLVRKRDQQVRNVS